MAEWPADVGDLVKIRDPEYSDDPTGPALVVEQDKAGWLRLHWPDVAAHADGFDRWYPSAKLQVISRGYKKDEEK
tara:strand:- start:473 stop:697 length:225 start_codon:yes stop_codon:yes gene_type:complete